MTDNLTFETVDGMSSAGGTRSRRTNPVVKLEREKGIKFTQFALALMAGNGNKLHALEIAKSKLGEGSDVVAVLKAAVGAGNTADPLWAGPLYEAYRTFSDDFVSYLRSKTITGAFGRNSVPDLRRVDFNLNIPTQVTGGAAGWVKEGAPIGLTRFDFSSLKLGHAKLGAIAVITKELARWSSPSAELIVRDQLAAAVIETLDKDFISTKAAVENESPAGILNGVAPITSSGSDIDAINADIEALYFQFLEAENPPETGVFILSSKLALRLSLMRSPLGVVEFPGLTFAGGRLAGLPVITSNYVPDDRVILVNASDIYFADGGVGIDSSDATSLQMDSAPTNNSVTPTGAALVSMYQTDSIATKVVKHVNYARRRPSAVAWLQGVQWGRTGS